MICIFVSSDYVKMDSLECVVHYSLKDVQYSNVTPLSENAHGRLLEAKAIRQELGGENEHKHHVIRFLLS